MASPREVDFVLPKSQAECRVCNMRSTLGVVITHPWGVLGGDMNNTIVMALTMWFQQRLGITTLRLDFQGSQIGRGHGQVEQVMEAASFLLDGKHLETTTSANDEDKRLRYILLVGYSYGSVICGSASAHIPSCIGVISIAPPFGVRHWLYCFNGNFHLEQAKRKIYLKRFYILGSNDNFTSEKVFTDILQDFPNESTTGAILKGADHFYHERKKDLLEIIRQWLLTAYPQCNGELQHLANCSFVLSLDSAMDDSAAKSNPNCACDIFVPE